MIGMNEEQLNNIVQLITQGKLKEVLQTLLPPLLSKQGDKNSANILLSRLNALEQNVIKGSISQEDAMIERNKIGESLLKFLNRFEGENKEEIANEEIQHQSDKVSKPEGSVKTARGRKRTSLKSLWKRSQKFLLYLLVYGLVLFMVGLLGFGRSIDFFVYQKFYDKNTPLDKNIMLIDIPRNLPGKKYDRKSYRDRTNSLLKELDRLSDNNNLPQAIILDIIFTENREGMDSLVASVKSIKEKGVKLYAIFDVARIEERGLEERKEEHAMDLYEAILEPEHRYLHTRANVDRFDSILGTKIAIVSYNCHIEMPLLGNSAGSSFAYALPLVVAADLNNRVEIPFHDEPITYEVPFGRPEEIAGITFRYESKAEEVASGTFDKKLPALKDKIIIIGSLVFDFKQQVKTPGPTLVAWAIDDQFHERTTAREVLDNTVVVIGLTLFFSLLVVLFFGLLFKYIKKLQQKPVLLALLSFVLTLAVLAGLFALILATDKIMMSRLTLWGILLTTLLTWHYALKFMLPAIVDGTGKYDVFISYSHAESDFVHNKVYLPLAAAKDANGEPLSIFYDQKSIGVSAEFTSKYMWAIANSKWFLPVFSKGYYDRNHCRNEVHLAYKRYVEDKIEISGVATGFDEDTVPSIYSGLNLGDAMNNEKFMERIISEIIKTKVEQ